MRIYAEITTPTVYQGEKLVTEAHIYTELDEKKEPFWKIEGIYAGYRYPLGIFREKKEAWDAFMKIQKELLKAQENEIKRRSIH